MQKCDHPDEYNLYTDVNQNNGVCTKCGKRWTLKLTHAGTALIYYDNFINLDKSILDINTRKQHDQLRGLSAL